MMDPPDVADLTLFSALVALVGYLFVGVVGSWLVVSLVYWWNK